MTTKKEFVIEFVIFGKRIRTTILAENEEQAKEILFDAVKKQMKIKFIVKPENEWNQAMKEADNLFNVFGNISGKKAKWQ